MARDGIKVQSYRVDSSRDQSYGRQFNLAERLDDDVGRLVARAEVQADQSAPLVHLFCGIAPVLVLGRLLLIARTAVHRVYDDARAKVEEQIEFSMQTRPLGKSYHWIICTVSRTLLPFYGGLLVVHFAITLFL